MDIHDEKHCFFPAIKNPVNPKIRKIKVQIFSVRTAD